jgi:hypothetical protein
LGNPERFSINIHTSMHTYTEEHPIQHPLSLLQKFQLFLDMSISAWGFPNVLHMIMFVVLLLLFSVDIVSPSIIADTPP